MATAIRVTFADKHSEVIHLNLNDPLAGMDVQPYVEAHGPVTNTVIAYNEPNSDAPPEMRKSQRVGAIVDCAHESQIRLGSVVRCTACRGRLDPLTGRTLPIFGTGQARP